MIIATSHETKSLSMDDRPGGDILAIAILDIPN